MQRNVKVVLVKLRIVLEDFLAVIGHSSDTELILTSLMELGTRHDT